MGFRENLRFIMDSRGIQTKELSALTEISENTLKSYLKENGAEPTVSKAFAIAKALDVTLELLVLAPENSRKEISVEFAEICRLFQDLETPQKRIIIDLIKSLKENL